MQEMFEEPSSKNRHRTLGEASQRLQGWPSIPPACWNDFCCRMHWSSSFSLGVSPFIVPGAIWSFTPIATFICWIWPTIPSLTQRKCLDMALDANADYTVSEPCPATATNDETTASSWSQYLLYLLSNLFNEIHKKEYRIRRKMK